MRKILVLAISILLLVLAAAPVSAQVEQQVTIRGSGPLVFGTYDAIFSIQVNTETGKVAMKMMFPGTIAADGHGYEQFLAGLYWEGEINDYSVDGNAVTVDCQLTTYMLPWHELWPNEPTGELLVQGELTGPGNRGEITIDAPWGGTIPGTIIIR